MPDDATAMAERRIRRLIAEDIAAFDETADRWESQTRYLSSLHDVVLHEDYQRIIGMVPSVVPLVLRRLAHEPNHWSWALRAITGEDPSTEPMMGNLEGIRRAWLQWGERGGYLPATSAPDA